MEWIQCSLKWPAFCEKGLNKPGVIVDVKDKDYNDKKFRGEFLIGDINTNRGVCDDCTVFSREATVVRYKILEWK